jgi:hypothetical protein
MTSLEIGTREYNVKLIHEFSKKFKININEQCEKPSGGTNADAKAKESIGKFFSALLCKHNTVQPVHSGTQLNELPNDIFSVILSYLKEADVINLSLANPGIKNVLLTIVPHVPKELYMNTFFRVLGKMAVVKK